MNYYKLQTSLYGLLLLVGVAGAVMISFDLVEGYLNQTVPIWTVNVQRFIYLIFGLYLDGIMCGMISIILLARYKTRKIVKKTIGTVKDADLKELSA